MSAYVSPVNYAGYVWLSWKTVSYIKKPKIKPMKNFPIDPDKRVIEILDRLDSNFSKEHTIDFYLYFPSILSAILVAFLVGEIGLEADIEPSAGNRAEWLCLVTIKITPKLDTLHKLHDIFEQIAESLDGKYDGWETMVMD